MYPAVTLTPQGPLDRLSSSSTTQFASSEVPKAPGEKDRRLDRCDHLPLWLRGYQLQQLHHPPGHEVRDYSGIGVIPPSVTTASGQPPNSVSPGAGQGPNRIIRPVSRPVAQVASTPSCAPFIVVVERSLMEGLLGRTARPVARKATNVQTSTTPNGDGAGEEAVAAGQGRTREMVEVNPRPRLVGHHAPYHGAPVAAGGTLALVRAPLCGLRRPGRAK